MASWEDRSDVFGDVVFFNYSKSDLISTTDEVFVWDLDKTYLDTSIDSLGGLFQALLEKAFHKRNIPGTRTLLQCLTRHFKEKKMEFPLFFITASPPQMEERIYEKITYDGIKCFGAFYKDNLKNIRPGRFWRLTRQVGYKLQALLQLRTQLSENVSQTLWGDDSESDAVIYNLYSDICSRRLSQDEIRRVLSFYHVTGEQVDIILQLQDLIPVQDPVRKIYINLATDTDPEYYLKFGRRTFPTANTFQVAVDLFQDQVLGIRDVNEVIQDMVFNYGFSVDELIRSFDEMIRRRVLGEKAYGVLRNYFVAEGMISQEFRPTVSPLPEKSIRDGRVYELEGEHENWVLDRVDYMNEYR
jgi:hypothetical protein